MNMYKLIDQLLDEDYQTRFIRMFDFKLITVSKVISRRCFEANQLIPKLSKKSDVMAIIEECKWNVDWQIAEADSQKMMAD